MTELWEGPSGPDRAAGSGAEAPSHSLSGEETHWVTYFT